MSIQHPKGAFSPFYMPIVAVLIAGWPWFEYAESHAWGWIVVGVVYDLMLLGIIVLFIVAHEQDRK